MAFAWDLAANVPVTSLAVIKQRGWQHAQLDALRESNKLVIISTPEYKKGAASFLEKRARER